MIEAQPEPARVIVAGSVNYDVVIRAPRHPLVGETLIGIDVHDYPGGKGNNQAIAAARAGANVVLVGCIGADEAGTFLSNYLQDVGVAIDHLRVTQSVTGRAYITLTSEDNSVVVIPGANADLKASDLATVEIGPQDVLVTQFEIHHDVVEAFLTLGKDRGARTIVNPSPTRGTSGAVWDASDVVIVNELEFAWLAEVFDLGSGPGVIATLRSRVFGGPDQAVVLTLGPHGYVIADASGVSAVSGHAVTVADTTGAGDCFLGNLASALVEGQPLRAAATFANAAAALCVQRLGAATSMPSREETRRTLGTRY